MSGAAKTAAPETPPVLACEGIYKSFGGVPVLKNASLALQPGTVTALAGENGAGKSTLMKIATGQYRPDRGRVLVRGQEVPVGNTQAAHRLGIAIVPQELASVMDLAVYENLFIGRELTGPGGLRRRAMIEAARRDLEVFELDIDPTIQIGRLPVGVRQVIEIVKATNTGAKAILLDEPSSAIARQEVERLYQVVRKLRDRGVAMLLTTHKMEEIRALADRVVVLRDGGLILDRPLGQLSDDDIITAMIGRELEDLFPPRPAPGQQTVLAVEDLRLTEDSPPFDLTVKAGEIVGLAGLVGAGRTEHLEAIFGARPSVSGKITVHGRPVRRGDTADAIAANLAFVPEDRKGAGAILAMDVLDNVTLPRLSSFATAGIVRNRVRRRTAKAVTESVQLRSRGLTQRVETLSGGNQQKVVLARWLAGDVDVMLLDEPTRGVDVGARSEIYRIITDLAAKGMAVVMASSDMPEILSLSHRALVLKDGAVAGQLSQAELADPLASDRIFRLASGTAARDVRPTAANRPGTSATPTDNDEETPHGC
ncbi:MAG: sugar ABC transporter ATP-binding protein [Bifidobacteriaceae bacterium]|jgi:ribose transport system ATP-binding protein|nr:sugar ABC transporter ATP-binding protein [Bifidobacteriaceae bacterium]